MTEAWRERALAAEAELVAVREDVTRLREAHADDLRWLAEDLPKYVPALRAAIAWAEKVQPHPDDRPEAFEWLDALITDLEDGASESKQALAALVVSSPPPGERAAPQEASDKKPSMAEQLAHAESVWDAIGARLAVPDGSPETE